MTTHKDQLISFLQEIRYPRTDELISRLNLYAETLYETNQLINLVSRKTPLDWYWTHHFLDSLLPAKCMDFSGKTVLDFGTGGGLPGVPIWLAFPDTQMYLLDATHRKIDALKTILSALHLDPERTVCSRLEDYALLKDRPSFDFILCRAVALEPRYIKPLRSLLKHNGEILFYKAQRIEDIEALPYREICKMQ
ncbi:MAG: 16S rRNA (guanine(527)-N(7))-methyltransferase RsmG, partial [Candidatus Cloacimonadaceae bacterium]|nr:16S rRNA (guanine(527)-N(7))-methyltransferase RsmG [Candidatus Cloacimonadaceae bacterium]